MSSAHAQLSDRLKVDGAPLLPEGLGVVEKVHVAALDHDLVLCERTERGDALQVGEHWGLLDVDEVVEDHEREAV